jgi:hypothetical protein
MARAIVSSSSSNDASIKKWRRRHSLDAAATLRYHHPSFIGAEVRRQ